MAKAVDLDTGELVNEPEFVKLYIRDLCRVRGLSSVQYKIFTFMLANMNNDNIVSFGPKTKERFLLDQKIKTQTFNNNISKLIEVDLIARIARNEFLVNKRYAVKVDWTKVQSIMWTTIYTKEKVETIVEVSDE